MRRFLPTALILCAMPLFGGMAGTNTTVCGVVTEVKSDTFDPQWTWVTVRTPDATLALGCDLSSGFGTPDDLRALIDAEASFACRESAFETWRASDRRFYAMTAKPVRLAPTHALARLHRQRHTGVVLLSGRRRFFLKIEPTRKGDSPFVFVVTPRPGEPMPAAGETADVLGFPSSGNYPSQLDEATVRIDRTVPKVPLASREIRGEHLVAQLSGDARKVPGEGYYGQFLRVAGTALRTTGDDLPRRGRFTLDCGVLKLSIDVSDLGEDFLQRIESGSRVEVCGLCLFEYDADDVPLFRSMTLVPGSADDVRILRPPPWWTTKRLLAVIGLLLAALVALFVKSRLANAAARLRFEERTRLAVELHDSVSQSLAGATLQIDAARDLLADPDGRVARALDVASKTLTSSHIDLQNCIWDLRNHALEDANLGDAVRRTLQPHLSGTRLSVRFNVPRARLSDNSAHALLRIVRELVSNAVRHGRAASVAVAGALDGDRLGFSVTDDGCGFDPAHRPGVAEGHFGLQGIVERVRRLNGRFEIDSRPGKGTKVKVWIESRC